MIDFKQVISAFDIEFGSRIPNIFFIGNLKIEKSPLFYDIYYEDKYVFTLYKLGNIELNPDGSGYVSSTIRILEEYLKEYIKSTNAVSEYFE